MPADTLVVAADSTSVAWSRDLATGDRLAAWPEVDVEVRRPDAGGLPVPDAPPGALVARFADGPPFAWPEEPALWTAPREGRLSFALNVRPAHDARGRARVVLVPLGARSRAAFPRPSLRLERTRGGLVAVARDRAGFGLDDRTLAFTVTSSHGVTTRLAAWVPPGEGRTVLPLPPPLELPPGVHTLTAEIADRLGNVGRSAPLLFHTP